MSEFSWVYTNQLINKSRYMCAQKYKFLHMKLVDVVPSVLASCRAIRIYVGHCWPLKGNVTTLHQRYVEGSAVGT